MHKLYICQIVYLECTLLTRFRTAENLLPIYSNALMYIYNRFWPNLIAHNGRPLFNEVYHVLAVEVGEPEMQYLAVLLQMHEMVHRLVVVWVVVVPPGRRHIQDQIFQGN